MNSSRRLATILVAASMALVITTDSAIVHAQARPIGKNALAQWATNHCKDPPTPCTAADVNRLLKGGADPNALDAAGVPPIVRVVHWGIGLDVLDAMIKGGARADGRIAVTDNTALMEVAQASYLDGGTKYIDALLAAGADVNARSAGGWTALMYAAYNGPRVAAVKVLLAAKADASIRGKDGATALSLAEQRLVQSRGSGGPRAEQSPELTEASNRIDAELAEVVSLLKAAGVAGSRE